MKRRHFLQTSSVGVMGLSLPAALLSLDGTRSQNIQHWLRQLALATGTRRRSALFVWSDSLRQKMLDTNTDLAKHGFLQENSAVYFYSSGQAHCFYPLVLRHTSTGLVEYLVPVFGRQPDGQWKKIALLTGYQIEALAHAATALADSQLNLAELLLPAGWQPAHGLAYRSHQGSVAISTRLQKGLANTTLTICQGKETLYTGSFLSQHCLSTTVTEPFV